MIAWFNAYSGGASVHMESDSAQPTILRGTRR